MTITLTILFLTEKSLNFPNTILNKRINSAFFSYPFRNREHSKGLSIDSIAEIASAVIHLWLIHLANCPGLYSLFALLSFSIILAGPCCAKCLGELVLNHARKTTQKHKTLWLDDINEREFYELWAHRQETSGFVPKWVVEWSIIHSIELESTVFLSLGNDLWGRSFNPRIYFTV